MKVAFFQIKTRLFLTLALVCAPSAYGAAAAAAQGAEKSTRKYHAFKRINYRQFMLADKAEEHANYLEDLVKDIRTQKPRFLRQLDVCLLCNENHTAEHVVYIAAACKGKPFVHGMHRGCVIRAFNGDPYYSDDDHVWMLPEKAPRCPGCSEKERREWQARMHLHDQWLADHYRKQEERIRKQEEAQAAERAARAAAQEEWGSCVIL